MRGWQGEVNTKNIIRKVHPGFRSVIKWLLIINVITDSKKKENFFLNNTTTTCWTAHRNNGGNLETYTTFERGINSEQGK